LRAPAGAGRSVAQAERITASTAQNPPALKRSGCITSAAALLRGTVRSAYADPTAHRIGIGEP
jgi:hypothetical protein